MLDPLLNLLAAKAKAGALVAGTALVTTALVGGGTVVYSAVSSESDAAEAAAVAAGAPATPTATIGVGKKGKGKGAENRSATATANIGGAEDGEAVVFVCDPTKNHGQNVSAYARSLPKGPGRGAQVSAAAKSDCGKKIGEAEAEAAEVEEPKAVKPPEAAKAEKPARAEKPAKAAKPAEADEADEAEDTEDADEADEAVKPAKAPKAATAGKSGRKD